jgi:transposase
LLGQVWPERSSPKLASCGRIRFRLDPGAVEAIVAAYLGGVSGDEVAVEFGVSRHTVHRLVRESGGAVHRKYVTPMERKLITELHAQGHTQAEIAARIQRSQSLVWRCLNQHRPDLSLGAVSGLAELTS